MKGEIVAAIVAPHPPHLVYAENPPQNEPTAECGWETLRWGYDDLRKKLSTIDYDVLIVHSPHWKVRIGHHFLGVEKMKSKSVDPVFPNLFRYNYDLTVDVDLSKEISNCAEKNGLVTSVMTNPDFRVDYGTIISCHLTQPGWEKPIVAISSTNAFWDYSFDYGQDQMKKLGAATREAVEKSGKKAVILASTSMSHRHFTEEGELPEDMSREHIYHHGNYIWDMKMIELMREGRSKEIMDIIPDFTEQTVSEWEAGSMSWLLASMDYPDWPADIHAYGTVIGTGNAVVSWFLNEAGGKS
jgi:2-aminophenol/2-amino-5-chlorophenol 1,6-dioxygenase beta subunit